MRHDAEKIKELNPLSVELARYGVEADRKGFSRCPFHSEKTASFRAYADGTFHCFGCGAHGDVITFVMKMEGLSFSEACKRLDRDITYSEQRKIDRIKREQKKQSAGRETALREYFIAFDNWKDNEEQIKLFEPQGPECEAGAVFIYFLRRRAELEHLLNCAEIRLLRAVNGIGL